MLENIAEMIVLRLDDFAQWLERWAEAHLLDILIILGVAWLVRRISVGVINRLLKHLYPTKSDRQKRVKTLHSLANGMVRLVVYVVAGILIVSEINPNYRTILFTSAGLIGAIVGFGAQNLIRDLVSGIFIIIENQYRIGDEVTLSAGAGVGSVDGIVEDLTIRTTIVRDLSGNVHHMPNGNIGLTSNKTLGYSRMNENIAVELKTDLDQLEKIVKDVGEELMKMPSLKDKLLEPPYLASVKGFTKDGIIVRISAKTSPASQWKVRSEFYRHLTKAFKKHKIQLAAESETSADED